MKHDEQRYANTEWAWVFYAARNEPSLVSPYLRRAAYGWRDPSDYGYDVVGLPW